MTRTAAKAARLRREAHAKAESEAALLAARGHPVSEEAVLRRAGQLVAKAEAGSVKRGRGRKAVSLSPGCDGRFEPGERRVDDPNGSGHKVLVRVNVAEHPVEWLEARGWISPSQAEAGRAFRRLYERAAVGPVGGIDPQRIRVDGGAAPASVSLDAIAAHNELSAMSRRLGMQGYAIVAAICGRGVSLADLARAYIAADNGSGDVKRVSQYLRRTLCERLDLIGGRTVGAGKPAAWRAAETLGVLMPKARIDAHGD